MTVSKSISDEEFAEIWRRLGSPQLVAQAVGCNLRNVYYRRNRVEQKLGIVLPSFRKDQTNRLQVALPKRGFRHIIKARNAVIPIFSDAHFWPGEARSTAYLALLEVIREFKPEHVICNGDVFDGARISRHPPVGWVDLPEVADELAFCQERLDEIRETAVRANPDCKFYWSAGNHDSRFAMRLAAQAPEFVRVHGLDLKDHFPEWSLAWSAEINGCVMVKHRLHSGIHAAWNNTLKSGWSMVTGHCHRLCVTPITDYNGRRWGVDTGTLSEFGPEFDKHTWAEDAPLNWCEGFAVLTFDDRGKLLPPELCEVIDGRACFRGQVIATRTTRKKAA